jgi:hypothetical protein
VKKEIFRPLNASRLIDQAGTGRRQDKFKIKYRIELPASTRIVRFQAVENLVKFYVYKLSYYDKRHMIEIFKGKHVQDTQ